MDLSILNLKDRYIQVLEWLSAHPNFSYWIVFFVLVFTILMFIYLIITNLRLHFHIRSLNRDKQRLMEEKDMMRIARNQQDVPEPVKPDPSIDKSQSP